MPTHRRLACSCALLLPLLWSAQCAQTYRVPARVSLPVTHTVELPAGTTRLEVQFRDGLLTLEPGPTLACEVTVEVLGDDDAEVLALGNKAVPVITKGERDTAQVQVMLPSGAALESVRTTWRVRAPDTASVAAITRNGGVVARGATCDLEVLGGTGVVDARMNGGAAVVTTTSGSILLRGAYPFAELHSGVGRIDVAMPPPMRAATELRVATSGGGVYLDLLPNQAFELLYRGLTHRVECDPEVRVRWDQVRTRDEVEFTYGRLGQLEVKPQGLLELATQDVVHVRLSPPADALGTR